MTDKELIFMLRHNVGVSDAATKAANLAADRIEQLLNQQDSIREATLREAAYALNKLADNALTALAYEHAHACRDEILDLIGDNK